MHLNKLILIIFLYCSLSNYALAKDLSSSLLDFTEYSHDFGTLKSKQIVKHHFKFTNNGSKPLIIYDIISDCDCMNTNNSAKDRIYSPGKSGFITAELNTQEFNGPMVRTLIIKSNEKLTGTKFLTLKANVQNNYQLSRSSIIFDSVNIGEIPPKQNITIKSTDHANIKINKLEYNKKLFIISSSQSNNDTVFQIELIKPLNKNSINEVLTLTTENVDLKKIKIPIIVKVKNNLKISSSRVDFGILYKKKSAEKKVYLTNNSPFRVISTDVRVYINGEATPESNNYLSYTISKGTKAKHQLKIKLTQSQTYPGDFYAKILIQTTAGPLETEVHSKLSLKNR